MYTLPFVNRDKSRVSTANYNSWASLRCGRVASSSAGHRCLTRTSCCFIDRGGHITKLKIIVLFFKD